MKPILLITFSVLCLTTFEVSSTEAGCGGNFTATKLTSVVTSPNYPNNHGNNLRCVWTITSSNLENIILTITDIDIEPCCDYLDVFDDGQKIGRFKGRSAQHISLISSSSTLELQFHSDGSVANAGFRATFKEVNNCGYPLLANKTSAYFSTPFYPRSHPPNLDCFWPIRASDDYEKVEVIFEEGQTNACCDYVEIFEGPNVLGRIKGNITKQMKFSSSQQTLGVYFHSVASASGDGFLASYKEFECGGTYRLSGTEMKAFSSPNYPESSAHFLDCQYTFNAEPGYRVELSLVVNTEECCDFLDLYEGNKHLGQLKGNIPKSTVVSLGQTINIHFHTDGSINSKGFRGTYRQVLPSCGKKFVAKNYYQVLASPGYPDLYPNDYSCSWILIAPTSYQVALQFKAFSTETCCDYVEIFDGLVSIGKLQGTIQKPLTIVSKTSRLVVRFYTDDSTRLQGFTATYKLTKNCGATLLAAPVAQKFTTPGYPNDYPDNLDCMWVLRARDFTNIRLEISSGETEKVHDYVQVLDGLQPIAQLHGWWKTERQFKSNSTELRVYFHSDESATRDGFTVSFQEVCNYTYEVTSFEDQFLTSPNYPNHSPHDYNCTYLFKAAPGLQVELQVLDLNTEECCDFVEIYENLTVLSTLRGQRNVTTPLSFHSIGNELKATYFTDSTMPSVGFEISYRLYRAG